VCKSFKDKLYSCRSVTSDKIARNYLAKHAFDSSNHAMAYTRDASLQAAKNADTVRKHMEHVEEWLAVSTRCGSSSARERSRSRGGSPAGTSASSELAKTSKRKYARVEAAELLTLESWLTRAAESQKSTVDGLNFRSRLIIDERKVFCEARNAIAEIRFNAQLGGD